MTMKTLWSLYQSLRNLYGRGDWTYRECLRERAFVAKMRKAKPKSQ